MAVNVDRIQVTSDTLYFTVFSRTYSIQVVTDAQINMTMKRWCPTCTDGVIIAWDATSPVSSNPSIFSLTIPTYPRGNYSILLDGQPWKESVADIQGRFSFAYDEPWAPRSFEVIRTSFPDQRPIIPLSLSVSHEILSQGLVRFSVEVDPQGDYTFLWEFGDGQVSDEQNPTHRYEFGFSARFNVRLTVCSEDQCAEVTQQISLIRWSYLAFIVGVVLLIAVLNLVVFLALKRRWVFRKRSK